MDTTQIFFVILSYFLVLMAISYFTSRVSDEETFFTGNRRSPWVLVAFGMVGAGLSGVTFVSLPGMVGNNNFHFFQFILGNVVGYLFITFVLVPLYYRLKLVSIYSYLFNRFGNNTYKTGSLFFLISQSFGAALRLLLAAKILQFVFFEKIGSPFPVSVMIILLMVWLYSYKSGIKTIVWTDTLQTTFLILGALITFYYVLTSLDLTFMESIHKISRHRYFEIFNWEGRSDNNFFKQFIAGILVAIAMIGLDQNMMQKTLTCKNVWDAQKNTLSYSLILAGTQFLFMGLGILLYIYAENIGIVLPLGQDGALLDTDTLFPEIALNQLSPITGIFFYWVLLRPHFPVSTQR